MRSILRWGVSVLAVLFLVPLCRADLVPRLVRDVDPTSYAGSSNPRQLVSLRHGFGFTALNGRELWVYDNQEDVLTRVLQAEEIRQLQENFYAARGADGRWTFWDLEGFPYYSATRIGEATLGQIGTIYRQEGVWLLFEGEDRKGGKGRGLWTLQSAETGPIARPLPLPDGHLLHDLTAFRDRAFFVARHRELGTALWVTDGTRAGTFPLFAPAPGKTPDLFLRVVGRKLLLAVSGGEPELWVSDGTARGTRPMPKIGRGPGAKILRAAAGPPFLVIDDGRHEPQLWTSDGTAAGTRRLTSFSAADPFSGSGSGPGSELPLQPLGGRWVFFADDGAHGRELWWTDGTPAGTRLLTDLCPGPCGTSGELLLTLPTADSRPDRLFFSAQAPGRGIELWSTDGTAAGTGLVADLCAGPCNSDPRDFRPVLAAATFTAATAEGPRALWISDGSQQGTVRLTPPGVTATTGLLMDGFFAASDAAFGEELWGTDGTPEGTGIWNDLQREEDSGSYPIPAGAAGGNLVITSVV
jgi:ELWxxDGT repeat protein